LELLTQLLLELGVQLDQMEHDLVLELTPYLVLLHPLAVVVEAVTGMML
jgi:hypothetical protein